MTTGAIGDTKLSVPRVPFHFNPRSAHHARGAAFLYSFFSPELADVVKCWLLLVNCCALFTGEAAAAAAAVQKA